MQFTLHGATGPVYVVDLLPYIYASFIPTAPSRIVFDLAVYYESLTIEVYDTNSALVDEYEIAASTEQSVPIEWADGIGHVRFISSSGEVFIDNVCITL